MNTQKLIELINDRKKHLKQQVALPVMDDYDEAVWTSGNLEMIFLDKLLKEIQNT